MRPVQQGRRRRALVLVVAVAGCASGRVGDGGLDGPMTERGDASGGDPPADRDGGADASPRDAGLVDAPRDAVIGAPIDAGALDAPPPTADYDVDIFVSNTCAMSVVPSVVDVPHGQVAHFHWHNRSADYPVDVWMSYGGGYTDLASGATWHEPPSHCGGPLAHDDHATISTGCASATVVIHCH